MGGQALKNTFTRRYERAEYYVLREHILTQLRTDFPARKIAAIQAYRTKDSFGDLDILMDTDDLNLDLSDYIHTCFKPHELVRNTNVYSFDYQQFQIDIIGSPSEDFDISLHYFAWNDLGNIIGRLYHKMGFKYGHNGLILIVRERNNILAEINLSKDINKILAFAELDTTLYAQGFDTLEDIFKFSASSPYFNKGIYLLDNRNHASRIRDKKRSTYNALLKWLETQDDLPAYPWDSLREHGGREIKPLFLQRAFEWFPHAKPQYEALLAQNEQRKRANEKFNGLLIQSWVGLEDKALGAFMRYLRERSQEETTNFTEWLDTHNLAEIRAWILAHYKLYSITHS
ncbi:hypothetical protein [Thiofilum flexile]|uniref:hypothetical protein n=1 Tax=Thiofilum flexile TaxID=125627 RepID=UPI00037682F2|nr:hypothetical protein [Thiofilum flexile]